MTVCFDFDSQKTPWITPFDRYNTHGDPVPDGKISTYDIKSIPDVLARYVATPVLLEDQRLCDAFYVEMVKLGFYNEVIKPQSERGQAIWQDKSSWTQQIRKSQASALSEITQRQQAANSDGRSQTQECDFTGFCVLNSFDSAKNFIHCIADKATQDVSSETPILAGPGIVLRRAPGKLPRIDGAVNEADHTLRRLKVDVKHSYIGSIDGHPTISMTDEEIQRALSGPEGSMVKLGIIDSAESRETGELAMSRTFWMGEAMTQCGGLDVMSLKKL